MRALFAALFVLLSLPAFAASPDIEAIVETHILPGYRELAFRTDAMADLAAKDCPMEELRGAFHHSVDQWMAVSHLRFGPSEVDDRAFALAFWPDPRGSMTKTLTGLIHAEDPVVETAQRFATVSIAARGFYALEYLLFDPQFTQDDRAAYRCQLIQAVTADIAANADTIHRDWQDRYAQLMTAPGNETYRTTTEAARQLFTSLSTGLEFNAAMRLGRPMGTFDRPRPKRAEMRRSGRSRTNVILSLQALEQLAAFMSLGDPQVAAKFADAIKSAQKLPDADFAGVATPSGRFQIEVVQQKIDHIVDVLSNEVGPSLGIAAGFNALDGD